MVSKIHEGFRVVNFPIKVSEQYVFPQILDENVSKIQKVYFGIINNI